MALIPKFSKIKIVDKDGEQLEFSYIAERNEIGSVTLAT